MIIRLACDSSQRGWGYAKDRRNLQSALLWRGNSIELQCGLFDAGRPLTSTDIGIIVVELKPAPYLVATAPIIRRNVDQSECDYTYTGTTDWFDGSKQLFTLPIDAEDLATATVGVYKLTIKNLLPGTEEVTYLSSYIQIREDGDSGSTLDDVILMSFEDHVLMDDESGYSILIEDWRDEATTTLPEI